MRGLASRFSCCFISLQLKSHQSLLLGSPVFVSDTKHLAPCSASLPFVFTLHLSEKRGNTRLLSVSSPLVWDQAFQSEGVTVPPSHVATSRHLNIHAVNQLNQQLIVINPTGGAPAAKQRALNRPNAEVYTAPLLSLTAPEDGYIKLTDSCRAINQPFIANES